MTKDTKQILYGLYKEYLRRRNDGASRMDSKSFDSTQTIQENFFPDISVSDVEDSLRELDNEGLVHNRYGSDKIYGFVFTDRTIEVMENQKKETLLSIANFVSKFIP